MIRTRFRKSSHLQALNRCPRGAHARSTEMRRQSVAASEAAGNDRESAPKPLVVLIPNPGRRGDEKIIRFAPPPTARLRSGAGGYRKWPTCWPESADQELSL